MQVIVVLVIALLEAIFHMRPDLIQKTLEAFPRFISLLEEGGKSFIKFLNF